MLLHLKGMNHICLSAVSSYLFFLIFREEVIISPFFTLSEQASQVRRSQ